MLKIICVIIKVNFIRLQGIPNKSYINKSYRLFGTNNIQFYKKM